MDFPEIVKHSMKWTFFTPPLIIFLNHFSFFNQKLFYIFLICMFLVQA